MAALLPRIMETLAIDDIQKLHQGIQQLYTLQNLDTFWVKALSIVTQIVPSDIPLHFLTNIRPCQTWHTFLPDFPGFSPELARNHQKYIEDHPIVQHLPQTLHGVYKLSDFVSPPEPHRLDGMYQQFLRPLDIEDQMVFFLSNDNLDGCHQLVKKNITLVGFALYRAQCNFTERDRTLLNLLRHHLAENLFCQTHQYWTPTRPFMVLD
jgi:hypothetical protein